MILAAGLTPVASAGTDTSTNNLSRKMRQAVSAAGTLQHERALQEIANENNGTRVSGTPGYDESKDYAVEVFEAAGYDVTVQPFVYQTFIPLSPSVLGEVSPTPRTLPHDIMTYSASGDVTAAASVPTGAATGCAPGDFGAANAGTIVVISRGACTFQLKAQNAEAAGAKGAVIYNNIPGALAGTLSANYTGNLPVVGITQALGAELVGKVPAGLTLHLKTDTFRGQATTYNVFAESTWGDPNNVVMAGAHLDSVPAGPGINDNGSGSAAILETAEAMAKVKPVNRVRFALWGAEESGLVGSNFYINDLKANDPGELDRIALYLNFDMVASPNYVRFVYDGDNSAFPVGPGAAPGPPGSAQIEDLFHDYFESVGLPSAETPFSGRSDYGPFIAAGVDIPSGGLFTGAEGTKTTQQAAVFGGVAGAAYDACYHQACDTLSQDFSGDPSRAALYAQLSSAYDLVGNVNLEALEEMGDAVAHAVVTFAFDTRSVNGEGGGHPVSPPGQDVDGTPGGAMDDAGGGLHDDHELPTS